MAQRKRKRRKSKRMPEWSKLLSLLTILFGFLIVQECLYLMYICIVNGYTATAAWLTAGVGVGEAVIIAGVNAYISLCKSDHKEGGITFEAAKAKGFANTSEQTDNDSPPI